MNPTSENATAAVRAPKKTYQIVTLPGDGVGPEVLEQAVRVLSRAAERFGRGFDIEEIECGGHYYAEHEVEWPEGSFEKCEAADAMLLGAVGHQIDGKDVFTKPGKPYDTPQLAGYAQVIGNRRRLQLYANVRPIKLYPGIRAKIHDRFKEVWEPDKVDYVVVRENTEDAYTGVTRTLEDDAGREIGRESPIWITRAATERVVRFAFRMARQRNPESPRVHCVEKSNIVGAHRYFREVFDEVGAAEFPDVQRDYAYFDAFCQWQTKSPEWFDVVVAPNLVGDVISDNGSMMAGGLGFAAGGNVGDDHAMFEPIHGSAPKHAGQDKVNPCAAILSAAMMAEWLGTRHGDEDLRRVGRVIEAAVGRVVAEGRVLTYDLGGSSRCSEMGEAIVRAIDETSE
jgi:3-isopropylmalate dehydrogenase